MELRCLLHQDGDANRISGRRLGKLLIAEQFAMYRRV